MKHLSVEKTTSTDLWESGIWLRATQQMQSVLSRTKYESEQPSLPLFQKNKRNMDFNELLFREMSPFCISSASSNYVVVGFAGRAFDGTKEATHGGSQFYPVPITCRSSHLYHCFKQTK